MKHTIQLVLGFAVMLCLASCALSCNLLDQRTSGTIIESISAPFAINDDIIFVNTSNRAAGIKDYTYVVNMATRSIVSVITYKYGWVGNIFSWGPEAALAVNGKLWLLGANMQAMRREVFIVDPATARLEKTLTYELDNAQYMYYLPSLQKVVLTHGSTYPDYHGHTGSPITVFDVVGERYETMYWVPECVNEFRVDGAGNIWGFINRFNNSADGLGIYQFNNSPISYELEYIINDRTCSSFCNSIRGWPYVVIPDNSVICSTAIGIVCKYADGSTSVIPAGDAVSSDDPYPREIEYCPIADRVFVNAVRTGSRTGIAVLEKDVNGKWVKSNTIIEDPNDGFLVRNGILVTSSCDYNNNHYYYLNFYSTASLAAGSLDKLGTLVLKP